KTAVRRGASDERTILVRGVPVALGTLKQHAMRIAPGQRIAYAVDAAHDEVNVARIVELARGADQLFIETAFLEQDRALAAARRHFTAARAGAIAGRAGVARLVPLHFSGRYKGREDELRREAEAAFRGTWPADQGAIAGAADRA